MKVRSRYLLAGIMFGCMFPLGAIVFEGVINGHLNILQLHMDNKIMFMIDSAPIFLGGFAYVGGIFQERSIASNNDLTASSEKLKKLLAELEIQSKEMYITQEKTNKTNNALSETISSVTRYVDDVQNDIILLDDEMIELHAKSSDLLSKSSEITEHSKKSYRNYQTGNEIVTSLSQSVSNLDSVLKKILISIDIEQNHIEELSKNLSEVDVLKTRVESVSNEIDLLALNASIEASRVGEAGRGFAVVANEIKKLSLESHEATSDMAKYLVHITQNYLSVSKSMNNISDEINQLDHLLETTHLTLINYMQEQTIDMKAIQTIQDTSISQKNDVAVLHESLDGAKTSISHIKTLVIKNKEFLNSKRIMNQ
ncbi:MAG: hypothetical protein JEZ08_11005 [Clostridiales bacterium]|nr:hypothetical protein [Clostridiales bacterium]